MRRRRRGCSRCRSQRGKGRLRRITLSESVGCPGGPAGAGADRRARARRVLRGVQEVAVEMREKRGTVIRGDAAR